MKYLHNKEVNTASVYNQFFAIASRCGRYEYSINATFGLLENRILHHGVKLHPIVLNRFSLTVFSIIGHVFFCFMIPVLIVYFPLSIYYEGMLNFIKNGIWATNVRLFNWVNFVLLIFSVAFIIYQNLLK
jgi:hypothetical protein